MRKAFVMASNGPNSSRLKYAEDDAVNLAECLTLPTCGYSVEKNNPYDTPMEALHRFYDIIEGCTEADEFICYFSGHGHEERGILYLLWNNTELANLLTTAIPISTILDAMTYCKAHNKLLILDCCKAGAAVRMTRMKSSETQNMGQINVMLSPPHNYLILMASESWEEAREFDQFKGSFLTTHIINALSSNFDEADYDKDGNISIDDLKRWIRLKAVMHNQNFPLMTVPQPILFGKMIGDDIFLSTKKRNPLEFETSLAEDLEVVILPTLIENSKALCFGKSLVTNEQYRKFAEATHRMRPEGQHIRAPSNLDALKIQSKGVWVGKFHPWDDPNFGAPNIPVTCVSYIDAIDYCKWISQESGYCVRLPYDFEWDWTFSTDQQFPRSKHFPEPHMIEITDHMRNVSIMHGISEWCIGNPKKGKTLDEKPFRLRSRFYNSSRDVQLSAVEGDEIKQAGRYTKRTNIGFRIVVEVKLELLAPEIQKFLTELDPVYRNLLELP